MAQTIAFMCDGCRQQVATLFKVPAIAERWIKGQGWSVFRGEHRCPKCRRSWGAMPEKTIQDYHVNHIL
jgi:hypothetical protein